MDNNLHQFLKILLYLSLALAMTLLPCALFGVVGAVIAAWGFGIQEFTMNLLSWLILTGLLFIYALADRVTLRAYRKLASYNYETGQHRISLLGLLWVLLYAWSSPDYRPAGRPRLRAYYYTGSK